MTRERRRAEEIVADADDCQITEDIALALDEAERRGEERVLRWLSQPGEDADAARRYRARRARVGRGR